MGSHNSEITNTPWLILLTFLVKSGFQKCLFQGPWGPCISESFCVGKVIECKLRQSTLTLYCHFTTNHSTVDNSARYSNIVFDYTRLHLLRTISRNNANVFHYPSCLFIWLCNCDELYYFARISSELGNDFLCKR